MQDIIIYMRYDGLLLKNQLCHPLYSASNALQRAYKRVLKKWGISYPQYLILLTLWEMDEQTVTQICEKTFFDSGTATPLLQKLSQKGLIQIKNLPTDKRSKVVSLSKKGLALKDKMITVPEEMMCLVSMNPQELELLTKMIQELYQNLLKSEN